LLQDTIMAEAQLLLLDTLQTLENAAGNCASQNNKSHIHGKL
jgi:hypothetical protein